MAGRFPHYTFTPSGIMIPTATPLPSLHPNQSSLPVSVPAKRDSDDVQFVSANPVKKRKLDHPDENLALHHPAVASNPSQETGTGSATDLSQNSTQPDRILSTASCKQPPAEPAPESDPLRGCSVPVLAKSNMFENLWTASSTRPRCSEALSPKQLPQHIAPALLRVDTQSSFNNQTPLPPLRAPETVLPLPTTTCSQGDAVLPPPCLASLNRLSREPTGSDTCKTPIARKDSSVRQRQDNQDSGLGRHVLTQLQQQDAPTATPLACPPKSLHTTNIPTSAPEHTVADNSFLRDKPSGGVGQQTPNTPASSLAANGSAIIQTHQPAVPSGRLGLPDAHQNGEGACTDASEPSGKGPCVHCLQKRLRQAAMITNAASLASVSSVPGAHYGLNSQIQGQHFGGNLSQIWPQQASMTPFPAQLCGPLSYGQVLPQHLTYNQTNKQIPQSQQARTASPQAPVAPMSASPAPLSTTAILPPFFHPSWYPQGPSPQAKQTPVRQPQTQFNGKHIIVDIAETCVEAFPFEEVAQRHNQPVKKVREIFEAIIQMPLMRCPTDKRRAGKQATAKVKEYTQARRELQAQMSNREGGQGRQIGSGQQPQPSAWEVAQFMGPSDTQVPGHFAFTGPWG